MSPLEIFSNALALSEEMAVLARQQDWDGLVAIERRRTALLATLPVPLRANAGDAGDAAAMAELIKKIQACDSEVREFVEPWMEHTKGLLARLSRSASVE